MIYNPADIGNYPYTNYGAYTGGVKAPATVNRPPQSAIELGTELIGRIPKQNINFNTYNHPAMVGARQQQLAAYPGGNSVNPNAMRMFLQGQSQEAVGSGMSKFTDFDSRITNNVPDFFKGDLGIPYSPERMENYPLNGFPYVGGLGNPAATTPVTSNIGSRPSVFSNNQQTGTVGTSGITSQTAQQVRRPVATDTAVVQQQQPPATVDTQPTTSQPISPIGLQGVTDAMNAQSTMGNPIPQSANTQGWFGTVKSWLGEKLGVDATQYLTNTDGAIMMTKDNIPILNADATTWKDVGAVAGGLANTAMGAYGMFTGMDQQQQALDTQRGQLNLMREKYAEDKRKNQAIVAQNRGA